MNFSEPTFTFGIEEEYLLIDLSTRDLAIDPRPEMMEACHSALGNSVGPEFLRSQIEVATGVCHDPGEARAQLADLRGTVERVVGRFDCALIAASTHPFGRWQDQKHTAAARYSQIAEDLRLVAQRLLTCGMHVHVAIEDPELRIDLMNQAVYFLPHLLALSTSSPFWDGADSGLMSYRLSVLDELPRSGLPDPFQSAGEYDRTVASLVSAGLIEDATKLWWDIRPSVRFPTLEMRITDVCTRLEDALCLAALFRCLCRLLYRLRRNNQSWRIHSRLLVNENRWRAQRYGSDRGLVDFGIGEVVPYQKLLAELLDLIDEDAAHFGCAAEVERARGILADGTSAHRQLAIWREAQAAGADSAAALRTVVDWLAEETVAGT
ncbi:MAG: carboxylate-amine ligase [Spirochaetaceae bacterium]|nr:carboxylate-amine ligase [Spirochaetaceae bacterium]